MFRALINMFIACSLCQCGGDGKTNSGQKATIGDVPAGRSSRESSRAAPEKPSELVIEDVSEDSISISWTDNSSNELIYEVEFCSGSNCTVFSSVELSPLAVDSKSITLEELEAESVYKIRVRATNRNGSSEWLVSEDIQTDLTPTPTPEPDPITVSECSTPTTTIVDKGLKSTSTNSGRGLFSDTKIIPGTRTPAIAYYDGSATGGTGSIKLSWWTGSSFLTESVAGDSRVAAGSATFIRLAFLSTGVPMVFWTTGGTTVKGAMRSTALTADGSWTAAVIDTVAGAASRAIEVSVSPQDDVGLIYLTNTIATGRARFAYCPSSCSSIGSFVPMTTGSDTIEASNITAAYMATGIGWCKHNSTTYYPAVAYPGNAGANVRYASCLGALSTCQTGAGWSGQQTTVVATAGVVTKLLLDSSTVGDVPKIISRNAANNALQVFLMNKACNAAPGYSFSSGNTLGGATTGTAWLNLIKSPDGYFHVFTNLAATAVNYFNSVTTNFTSTTWNTAGTVDTLTLPAAGAGAGGADINSTDKQAYISYGGAAAPFNLFMGVVSDYTTASSSNSNVYYSYVPDVTGGITLPLSTGQTRNNSTQLTSENYPGTVYVDNSIGTAAGALLKYAFRSSENSGSTWGIKIIPTTSSPMFPSLAYDHNDLPWISYYDAVTFRYYLVTNASTDGSGTWSTYQFPINTKAANGVAPARDDTAMAMYYAGGIAKPVMFIMNSTAAGGSGVRAALFDPSVSAFVSTSTVDALGVSFGTRLAADFDRNGNIVVTYYDLTVTKAKFNFSTTAQSWLGTAPQVTAATTGREGLAIKLNPLNSKPAISYYDRANNMVYFTQCTSTLTSCSIGSNWSTSTISSAAGVSGVAAANEQVLNTSLSFFEDGTAFVSYMKGIGSASNNVSLASNSSGTFSDVVLHSQIAAGVSGAAALNFAMTGLNVSTQLGSNGITTTTFIGPNNWLYATSCEP